MVKKKSTGSGIKKGSAKLAAKTKSSRAPKVKWYVWVIFGLLLVMLCNMAYRNVVTRRDVALLDKAEAKMRQIEFPDGQKGVIERYCSERSVKFGSPGKPNCGVGIRFDIEYNDDAEYKVQSAEFLGALQTKNIKLLERRVQETSHYYSVWGLSDQLECSLSNVEATNYKNKSQHHVFYFYCQKQFQTKLYPIRD